MVFFFRFLLWERGMCTDWYLPTNTGTGAQQYCNLVSQLRLCSSTPPVYCTWALYRYRMMTTTDSLDFGCCRVACPRGRRIATNSQSMTHLHLPSNTLGRHLLPKHGMTRIHNAPSPPSTLRHRTALTATYWLGDTRLWHPRLSCKSHTFRRNIRYFHYLIPQFNKSYPHHAIPPTGDSWPRSSMLNGCDAGTCYGYLLYSILIPRTYRTDTADIHPKDNVVVFCTSFASPVFFFFFFISVSYRSGKWLTWYCQAAWWNVWKWWNSSGRYVDLININIFNNNYYQKILVEPLQVQSETVVQSLQQQQWRWPIHDSFSTIATTMDGFGSKS